MIYRAYFTGKSLQKHSSSSQGQALRPFGSFDFKTQHRQSSVFDSAVTSRSSPQLMVKQRNGRLDTSPTRHSTSPSFNVDGCGLMNRTSHFMSDGVVWRYSDIMVHGSLIDRRLRSSLLLAQEFAEQLAVTTMGTSCDNKMVQRFLQSRHRRMVLPEDIVVDVYIDFSRFRASHDVKFKAAVKVVVLLKRLICPCLPPAGRVGS